MWHLTTASTGFNLAKIITVDIAIIHVVRLGIIQKKTKNPKICGFFIIKKVLLEKTGLKDCIQSCVTYFDEGKSLSKYG